MVKSSHPSVFLFLLAPYGIAFGYVGVTLSYLLARSGVGVSEIATMSAIGLLPQTWKVLWAPLIDTTLSRKRWYVLAAVVTAVGMAASGFVPADAEGLRLITFLVFAFNVSGSFQCMAAESLMANATSEDRKGQAGGWSQAGNLGGLGLGGGAGLWLSQHLGSAWLPGVVLGALCLMCSFALHFLEEPAMQLHSASFLSNVRSIVADVFAIVRTRSGYLAFVLLLLPIGTGAAQYLWAAIAGDWRAGADTIALVNGAIGGLISALGCLAGGYISDLVDRKTAYCLYGVTLAAAALLMALAPRNEAMFVVFTTLYNFIIGLSWAGFTAVALEAVGRAGCPATKYNLMACAANLPIAGLTWLDGQTQSRWGSGAMLSIEALLGLSGILLFWAFASLTRRVWPA